MEIGKDKDSPFQDFLYDVQNQNRAYLGGYEKYCLQKIGGFNWFHIIEAQNRYIP